MRGDPARRQATTGLQDFLGRFVRRRTRWVLVWCRRRGLVRRTIRTGGIRMWPEVGVSLFNWHGVPPCWRAYFLLLRQKKVAKEKATPGSAPFGFLPLLGGPWTRLRNSGCALRQSSPDCPRPALRCSAPLMGTRKASTGSRFAGKMIPTVNPKKPRRKMKSAARAWTPYRAPWKVPSNAGAGGKGLQGRGLSEGDLPEFRSPNASPE